MTPKPSQLVAEWRRLEAQGDVTITQGDDHDVWLVVGPDLCAVFVEDDKGLTVTLDERYGGDVTPVPDNLPLLGAIRGRGREPATR